MPLYATPGVAFSGTDHTGENELSGGRPILGARVSRRNIPPPRLVAVDTVITVKRIF
jgi:hypothetical protein